MQGRALFTFIAGLENEEYQLLIAMIGIGENNADMRLIAKTLRKLKAYDEVMFLRQTKLTKRRFGTLSRKIVSLAVGAVGLHDDDGLLYNAFITVRKLVFRMDVEPAASILTVAIRTAEKQERFEILYQLHELAELMRLKVDGLSKDEVIQLQINLGAYRALENKLRRIPQGKCSPDERSQILREVEESPVMQSVDQALSTRSEAAYYKILSGSLVFSGAVANAVGPQTQYVEFLESTEWLKGGSDFYLAKEMIQLCKILTVAGRINEAQSVVFKVGNIECRSERAEQEKLKQLYPYRMQFAISSGNTSMGNTTLDQMNLLLQQEGRFDPLFCTDNIYYALYFCIASGNKDQGGILVSRMRKYQSKEFHPRVYAMAKMLEIMLAFETGDMEDCSRLIKNFRKSKVYGTSKVFSMIMSLMTRLVNQSSSKHPAILRKFHSKAVAMEKEGRETIFFHYFDFPVWIESKIKLCPMMDLFHHRTEAISSQQQTRTQVS